MGFYTPDFRFPIDLDVRASGFKIEAAKDEGTTSQESRVKKDGGNGAG